MPRPDSEEGCSEVVARFAEDIFERQVERFQASFGYFPQHCDPIFFCAEESAPEPMPPQEILSLVIGEALANEGLGFRTVDGARAFAILVLIRLGLSVEGAREAMLGTGRFRVH